MREAHNYRVFRSGVRLDGSIGDQNVTTSHFSLHFVNVRSY